MFHIDAEVVAWRTGRRELRPGNGPPGSPVLAGSIRPLEVDAPGWNSLSAVLVPGPEALCNGRTPSRWKPLSSCTVSVPPCAANTRPTSARARHGILRLTPPTPPDSSTAWGSTQFRRRASPSTLHSAWTSEPTSARQPTSASSASVSRPGSIAPIYLRSGRGPVERSTVMSERFGPLDVSFLQDQVKRDRHAHRPHRPADQLDRGDEPFQALVACLDLVDRQLARDARVASSQVDLDPIPTQVIADVMTEFAKLIVQQRYVLRVRDHGSSARVNSSMVCGSSSLLLDLPWETVFGPDPRSHWAIDAPGPCRTFAGISKQDGCHRAAGSGSEARQAPCPNRVASSRGFREAPGLVTAVLVLRGRAGGLGTPW